MVLEEKQSHPKSECHPEQHKAPRPVAVQSNQALVKKPAENGCAKRPGCQFPRKENRGKYQLEAGTRIDVNRYGSRDQSAEGCHDPHQGDQGRRMGSCRFMGLKDHPSK